MLQTVTRVVGNRELILGIDHFYRDAMKFHEVERLLPAAEIVARQLGVAPAEGPTEGYYAESPELARYFHLMRALQHLPASARPQLAGIREFQLLWGSSQSAIFGVSSNEDSLLPPRRDALYFALLAQAPQQWSINTLLNTATREAVDRDDISLVGLACRAKDAVGVAALRESVVLYADIVCAMASRMVRFVHVWNVDPELAEAANRFITALNELTGASLPAADRSHAEMYFFASQNNNILGRCARIACDEGKRPVRHYHWAVDLLDGEFTAVDFWKDELWTTDRFRAEHRIH